MAILKVDTISGIGTEGPVFEGDIEFTSQNFLTLPKGDTAQRGRGRGVFGGGVNGAPSQTNNIAYINIQSQGNTIKFGDLTSTNKVWTSAFGSSTRAIWPGGAQYNGTNPVDIIDFVTIATTSNATDFGDLSAAKTNVGSHSSQTRGVIAGGYLTSPGSNINVIEFVTIATTGDAADFGDLTLARHTNQACSNATRAINFSGGSAPAGVSNVIDFITMATLGNAVDFGDTLFEQRNGLGAMSSSTRAVLGGGFVDPETALNVIQFVEIATTGNAIDFGDLQDAKVECSGCSNGHGGL